MPEPRERMIKSTAKKFTAMEKKQAVDKLAPALEALIGASGKTLNAKEKAEFRKALASGFSAKVGPGLAASYSVELAGSVSYNSRA